MKRPTKNKLKERVERKRRTKEMKERDKRKKRKKETTIIIFPLRLS